MPTKQAKKKPKARTNLKQKPQPKGTMSITGIQKQSGKVVGYKFNDGKVYPKNKAVTMCKQGKVKDVSVSSRYGSEYLRTTASSTGKSLEQLPTIK